MNRRTRLFVAASLFLLTVSQWVFAQGRGASLSGVIKDAAGAPIPGAAVIVRNPGTSQTRDAVSDEQGRYAFLSLDLGQHEVTAQKHGFKPARIAVELSIGQQAEADIRVEFFNVFNHANFAIPTTGNLTVFNSATERNTTAGQITQTSTPGRQLQFALRIAF